MRVYLCASMRINMHPYIPTCMCASVHACLGTCKLVCKHMHALAHVFINVCMRTHIHLHAMYACIGVM